jgi:phage-related protein
LYDKDNATGFMGQGDFADFPEGAQAICLAALTIAAEGGKADVAKPLKGLGSGVMEIALPYRGDALGWSMRCRSARIYG